MNIIEDRITVERLVQSLEQGDPELRVKLHAALREARLDGGRYMTLLMGAAVAAAGGSLELRPDALAACGVGVGFTIAEDLKSGALTVTIVQGVPSELLAALRAAGLDPVALQPVPVVGDPSHQVLPVEPADPNEPPLRALHRISHAVKMFLLQHYAGELQARGRAFATSLMAGLHGEAIGVSLAEASPEDFEARLDAVLATLPEALKPMAVLAHELTQTATQQAVPGLLTTSLH